MSLKINVPRLNVGARVALGRMVRFGGIATLTTLAACGAKDVMVQKMDNGNLAWRAPQIPTDFTHMAQMAIADFWSHAKITLAEQPYQEFEGFVKSQLELSNPNAIMKQGSFVVPKSDIDLKLEELLKAAGPDPKATDALTKAQAKVKELEGKIKELDKKLSTATAKPAQKVDSGKVQELRTELKEEQNALKRARAAHKKEAQAAAEKHQAALAKLQLQLEEARLKAQEEIVLRQGQKAKRRLDIIDSRARITDLSDVTFTVVDAADQEIGKVTINKKKSNLDELIFALIIRLNKDATVGTAYLSAAYPIMVDGEADTASETLQALRLEVLEARQRTVGEKTQVKIEADPEPTVETGTNPFEL